DDAPREPDDRAVVLLAEHREGEERRDREDARARPDGARVMLAVRHALRGERAEHGEHLEPDEPHERVADVVPEAHEPEARAEIADDVRPEADEEEDEHRAMNVSRVAVLLRTEERVRDVASV